MAKKNTPKPAEDATVENFHEAMTGNISIEAEMQDMEHQLERLIQQNLSLDNKLATEHKLRMRERNAAEGTELYLRRKLQSAEEKLQKERIAKEQKQKKRLASIPALAIVSLTALALIAVPNVLHQFQVIGQQLSFAIQSVLVMVVAWCMALIWDRAAGK